MRPASGQEEASARAELPSSPFPPFRSPPLDNLSSIPHPLLEPGPSLKVLVVEDEPGDQWLLAELARSRGHVVIACGDAESAWEFYQAEEPALVLLDLVLPGADGLDLCRKIRRSPGGESTVVLVVTGKKEPEVLVEVLEAGADDYLAKPVDVPRLGIRMAVAERNVRRQIDRRSTRDALAAKTRELETLLENLDQVFFSIDVEKGRLIQVSPGTDRLLGEPLEDLVGESAWWAYLLPRPPERSRAMDRLESGTSVQHTYAVEGPAGSRWLEAVLKPEMDASGYLRRIDGVISDTTERTLAQEQLAARNRELSTLYRISEATLTARGLDEGYEEILDEIRAATGYPVALVEHLDDDRDHMVVVALREPGEGSPGELRYPLHRTPSGEAVRSRKPVVVPDLRTQVGALPDELADLGIRAYMAFPMMVGDEVVGALVLGHTEPGEPEPRMLRWGASLAANLASFADRLASEAALKESEKRFRTLAEKLQQANDELESFAYSVSHDLRAPLRTMQGFAHALLQDFGDRLEPQARDYARRIIRSGQQSEELISDLLAYSRLSSEKLELRPVDLDQVVSEAREQVAADLDASEARVRVEGPLPEVRGHHLTLVRVVANLLSNAVKFVPEDRKPEIVIRAEDLTTHVRILVEDNGIGVPEDKRDRIFRVFERLGGDVGARPGTGIGLAIVRRGIQRMGGETGVESRQPHGSTFWIRFPRQVRSPWRPWSRRR